MTGRDLQDGFFLASPDGGLPFSRENFLRLLEAMARHGGRVFALIRRGRVLALAGVGGPGRPREDVWVYDVVNTSRSPSAGFSRMLLDYLDQMGVAAGAGRATAGV